MRNEAVGLTKVYQGKPWVWLRDDDGPPAGSLVWCLRVERRGKDKRLVTVIRHGDAEVTCHATPDEVLGVPEVSVWREHLSRRQWLIEGKRLYIIDFVEDRKPIVSLSERDPGYSPLGRKARQGANRSVDMETSFKLREAADSTWSGALEWASRSTHARISGDDPTDWRDDEERESAWRNEWFIYGVDYRELIACEQEAGVEPLSEEEAGMLWEEGWSRVQFDC